MPFSILPALIPDIRTVYDVFFSAFQADPKDALLLDILFPGGRVNTPEFREGHRSGTLNWWHTSTDQYTFKCIDTDTGEIVGMALLDVYIRERSEEQRKNPGVLWLQGKERELAERIVNPLADMREKLWGGRPYIYCHVIAVKPEFQRQKAGTAIVSWQKDLVDQLGLPMYLESNPSIKNFYEKMGFETLPETIVHKAGDLGTDEDVEVPLM
ncbi:hypothetical protein MPDQ_005476, partial [Monascus purpureus]